MGDSSSSVLKLPGMQERVRDHEGLARDADMVDQKGEERKRGRTGCPNENKELRA